MPPVADRSSLRRPRGSLAHLRGACCVPARRWVCGGTRPCPELRWEMLGEGARPRAHLDVQVHQLVLLQDVVDLPRLQPGLCLLVLLLEVNEHPQAALGIVQRRFVGPAIRRDRQSRTWNGPGPPWGWSGHGGLGTAGAGTELVLPRPGGGMASDEHLPAKRTAAPGRETGDHGLGVSALLPQTQAHVPPDTAGIVAAEQELEFVHTGGSHTEWASEPPRGLFEGRTLVAQEVWSQAWECASPPSTRGSGRCWARGPTLRSMDLGCWRIGPAGKPRPEDEGRRPRLAHLPSPGDPGSLPALRDPAWRGVMRLWWPVSCVAWLFVTHPHSGCSRQARTAQATLKPCPGEAAGADSCLCG